MKNLLILSLLILSFFLLSLTTDDRQPRKVDAGIYTVIYSEDLEQPLEVWYNVQCPGGKASRAGLDFYTNDSIHTSSKEDYENNIYDKGHMAPSADFSCDRATIQKTFSYLNCALQDQYLNRGAWRLLEIHEREIALKTKVSVHIILKFDEKSIKLPTGATVPSGFTKEIKYGEVTEVYYFANEKPKTSSYKDYIIK